MIRSVWCVDKMRRQIELPFPLPFLSILCSKGRRLSPLEKMQLKADVNSQSPLAPEPGYLTPCLIHVRKSILGKERRED